MNSGADLLKKLRTAAATNKKRRRKLVKSLVELATKTPEITAQLVEFLENETNWLCAADIPVYDAIFDMLQQIPLDQAMKRRVYKSTTLYFHANRSRPKQPEFMVGLISYLLDSVIKSDDIESLTKEIMDAVADWNHREEEQKRVAELKKEESHDEMLQSNENVPLEALATTDQPPAGDKTCSECEGLRGFMLKMREEFDTKIAKLEDNQKKERTKIAELEDNQKKERTKIAKLEENLKKERRGRSEEVSSLNKKISRIEEGRNGQEKEIKELRAELARERNQRYRELGNERKERNKKVSTLSKRVANLERTLAPLWLRSMADEVLEKRKGKIAHCEKKALCALKGDCSTVYIHSGHTLPTQDDFLPLARHVFQRHEKSISFLCKIFGVEFQLI